MQRICLIDSCKVSREQQGCGFPLALKWVLILLVLAGLTTPLDSLARQADDTDSVIQYLLNYVADSGLTFIRNSEKHDAADAARHMNSKYQYFRGRIKTPEDFIRRSATKSLMTGKPYLVILENGEAMRTEDWLLHALKDYRHSQAAYPD